MGDKSSIEWTNVLCTKERARQLALPSSLTTPCDRLETGQL